MPEEPEAAAIASSLSSSPALDDVENRSDCGHPNASRKRNPVGGARAERLRAACVEARAQQASVRCPGVEQGGPLTDALEAQTT